MPTTSASATAIAGIDLIGPTVPDLQRSLAFYRDQLGLVPSAESDGGAEFHLPDGTTFGLWQPPADSGFEHHFTIMFATADARAASERYRELGARLAEPMESPVCHMAPGSDPEGNSIIIHQRKAQTPHDPRQHAYIRGIDIAGFIVGDAQGAMAYYNGVLGLQPTNVDDQGRGAEYELSDGSTFGVWQGDDGQPKGGFVMFAVDDLHAAVPAMRERGVSFVTEIMESQVCFMAPCVDPDGNAVIIHQRKRAMA